MRLKTKRILKRVATVICALIFVITCLCSCNMDKETGNDLSSALDTIAKENAMANTNLRKADKNFRLIKGKVFLWEDANDWRDIWDNED